MKIVAATLLAYAGLLNLDCAVSEDAVRVKMSNNHIVGGPLSPTSEAPNWIRPRENPPVFQGYDVLIRLCVGAAFVSHSLQTKVSIPGHNPAQEVPASVKVRLWGENLRNVGEFQRYDPANPPRFWFFEDYLLITRQGTRDIYWVKLEMKRNPIETHRDATVRPSSPGESSQRPRRAQ